MIILPFYRLWQLFRYRSQSLVLVLVRDKGLVPVQVPVTGPGTGSGTGDRAWYRIFLVVPVPVPVMVRNSVPAGS